MPILEILSDFGGDVIATREPADGEIVRVDGVEKQWHVHAAPVASYKREALTFVQLMKLFTSAERSTFFAWAESAKVDIAAALAAEQEPNGVAMAILDSFTMLTNTTMFGLDDETLSDALEFFSLIGLLEPYRVAQVISGAPPGPPPEA